MIVRLDQVAEVIMGQAPIGSDYNDLGEGWPLIAGPGDFGENIPRSKKYTRSASKLSRTGDIILGIRASIGATVWSDGEYCLGRGVAAVRPGPDVNPGFLWHWLAAHRDVLSMKGRGATFLQVNRADVAELEVELPPLPEQRRIASILDGASALLDAGRRTVLLLDEMEQSIFLSTFDVPSDRAGLSSLGRLEDHSLQITDGEHITPARAESGFKLLSARNVRNGYLDFTDVDFVGPDEFARISKRCAPVRGDVLISCSGSVGRVSVVDTDEPLALVRSVALVRPAPTITSLYLERYLRSAPLQAEIGRRARSSAQANLFQGPIRGLPLLVPTMAEQMRFSIAIQEVGEVKRKCEERVSALDELFASLQHRAFTGQL